MSRHWIAQRERGSAFAIKLIARIALTAPRALTRLLLYPITAYFLFSAGSQRRASRDYLRRVFARRIRWPDIARHIHCFASTILDRVYFLADRHELFDIRVHVDDALHQRIEQGGCILLGSHLGSFEALRSRGIARRKLPIKILMYREHNQILTGILDELNPEIAASVIDLARTDSLLQAHEALQNGAILGMLGDRVAHSDKTVRCQFLGEQATFPAGPMLLAGALKVPVILFFGLYRGGRRYDLHFELFAEQVDIDRKQRQADMARWTQAYAARLEYYLRQAPYNWFNFYNFWNENSADNQPPGD